MSWIVIELWFSQLSCFSINGQSQSLSFCILTPLGHFDVLILHAKPVAHYGTLSHPVLRNQPSPSRGCIQQERQATYKHIWRLGMFWLLPQFTDTLALCRSSSPRLLSFTPSTPRRPTFSGPHPFLSLLALLYFCPQTSTCSEEILVMTLNLTVPGLWMTFSSVLVTDKVPWGDSVTMLLSLSTQAHEKSKKHERTSTGSAGYTPTSLQVLASIGWPWDWYPHRQMWCHFADVNLEDMRHLLCTRSMLGNILVGYLLFWSIIKRIAHLYVPTPLNGSSSDF